MAEKTDRSFEIEEILGGIEKSGPVFLAGYAYFVLGCIISAQINPDEFATLSVAIAKKAGRALISKGAIEKYLRENGLDDNGKPIEETENG